MHCVLALLLVAHLLWVQSGGLSQQLQSVALLEYDGERAFVLPDYHDLAAIVHDTEAVKGRTGVQMHHYFRVSSPGGCFS